MAAILAARGFPPAAFAAYSYFQLTVSTFAAFSSFGLGVAASQHFAALDADHKSASFPLGTLWLTGSMAALVAGGGLLIVPKAWVSSDVDLPVAWVAAGVCLTVFNVVPAGAILGLQLYRANTLNSLLTGTLQVLGVTLAVSLQSLNLAFVTLLACFGIQHLADAGVVVRRVGLRTLCNSMAFSAIALKRLLGLTGPLFAVSLLTAGGSWATGRLMLAADRQHHQFALYTIGMQWFSLVLLLPGVLSKVSLPLLVRHHVLRAGQGSEDVMRASALLATLTAAAIALVVGAAAPWLAQIYGDNYEIHRGLLLPFLLAAVTCAPANVIGNQIVVAGRQWAWLGLTAVAMMLLVSVAWASIGFGAYGGGMAQLVSGATLTSVSWIVANRWEQPIRA